MAKAKNQRRRLLKDTNKGWSLYIAIALITGTVIGAGVLGIPYAISKAGFVPGMINLAVIGIIVTLMTLYMGEVVLRTKETKQFTGLAEFYLGRTGKYLMLISLMTGIYGALIAYLVGIGSSAANLFGGNAMLYSVGFFIIGAAIVFFGLKTIGKVELILSAVLVSVLLLICLFLLPKVEISNISYMSLPLIFAPYGVILFATLGYSVIPEVEIVLAGQKKQMWKAIIAAMAVCLGLYAFFALTALGSIGPGISEIATESLPGIFHILGAVVAILAMATGFLTLSMVLKHTYIFDLGINKYVSWLLACFVPFIIVLIISPSFITAVGLTGSYAGGLTGILACLMVKKAREKGDDKPAFVVPGGNILIYLSILIFILGIVYQTVSLAGFI